MISQMIGQLFIIEYNLKEGRYENFASPSRYIQGRNALFENANLF